MQTVRCVRPSHKIQGACLLLLLLAFVATIKMLNVGYQVDSRKLPSMTEENDDFIADYSFDDPRLLEHIRKYYLEPPSRGPLTLEHPELRDHSQFGQSAKIAEMLNNKHSGTFLEVGAYDGETYSNSLYFERFLNWTGLLIEADPANLYNLRKKHRNAWILKGCIDGGKRPVKRNFFGALEIGALSDQISFARRVFTYVWRPTATTEVWCFPTSSVFKAAKIWEVDYAVIDVEGAEMDVVNSLPFDDVKFGILQVEYAVCSGAFWDQTQSANRKAELEKYVKDRLKNYSIAGYFGLDMIIKRLPNF